MPWPRRSTAAAPQLNHNLHQGSDLVQRFLNVLHPGTYVRPHRHVRDVQGTGFECRAQEPSVCCY